MSVIRRIRIGKLTGYYQENDLEAMNFIQNILNKMVIKTHKNYPNKIFYLIDDKVYLEMKKDIQKRKNGYLWCKSEYFWKILDYKYQLKIVDIQSLIKSMVEDHLKCKVGTPLPVNTNHLNQIEHTMNTFVK